MARRHPKSHRFRAERLEDRRMLADSVEVLPIGGPNSSSPRSFITANERVLFEVNIEDTATEVWSTDGTRANTFGLGASIDTPHSIASKLGEIGGRAVFTDRDGLLWSSDGTPGGTLRLGIADANTSAAQLGRRIVYAASANGADVELFSTDGTTAGTWQVKDINANGGSYPAGISLVADQVLYFAADEQHGRELWRTNGSAEGTVLAADLEPGFGSFLPWNTAAVGSFYYFTGANSEHSGLWRYDVDHDEAHFVREMSIESQLRVVNDRLLVHTGQQLARYDESLDVMVVLATFSSVQLPQATIGGQLYFSGKQTQNSYVLWKTDGMSVVPVSTLDEPSPPWIAGAADARGGSVFLSTVLDNRITFWLTDGTPGNTSKIAEAWNSAGDIASLGSRIYFAGFDAANIELWVFDINTRVARQLVDVRPGLRLTSGRVNATSDSLLVPNDQYFGDYSLSEIDRETHQVRFAAIPEVPRDGKLVILGDRRLYASPFGKIWSVDETGQYELLLEAGAAETPTVIGSQAFIAGSGRLWSTDGTLAGMQLLAENVGLTTPAPNGMVFVETRYPSVRTTLNFTDGTVDGTRMLCEVANAWTVEQVVVAPNGTVYFEIWDGLYQFCAVDVAAATPVVLWETSEWAKLGLLDDRMLAISGTGYFVSESSAGPARFAPWNAAVGNPANIYAAPGESFAIIGQELWVIDAAGAVRLHAAANNSVDGAAFLDGRLYFAAYDDIGLRLWRTNGTIVGTEAVADLNLDGKPAVGVSQFVAVDRQLFLSVGFRGESRAVRYVPGYGSPRLVDHPVTLHDGQGRDYLVETGSGDQIRSALPGDVRAISLQFDQHVDVRGPDLSVVGSQTGAYGIANFQYDATTFTARWTLNRPIDEPDQITLTLADRVHDPNGTRLDGEWVNPTSIDGTRASVSSGDWQEGGAFVFRFTVLPGDTNRDNRVDGQDYQRWADLFGTLGGGAIDEADFNGDGAATGDDYLLWADAFGTDFSTAVAALQASAPLVRGSGAPLGSTGMLDRRSSGSAQDHVLAAVWAAGQFAEDALDAVALRPASRSASRGPGGGLIEGRDELAYFGS